MKKWIIISALALFFNLSQAIRAQASSRLEVVTFAETLARKGEAVDFDGRFGPQCADLITWISYYYFEKVLTGNASDFLKSAEAVGFEIVTDNGYQPQKGDVFVMASHERFGHAFGHTGIIVGRKEDGQLLTVEQNIDSEATALTQGGPARFNRRDPKDRAIIGYIRLPYTPLLPEQLPKSGQFRNDKTEQLVYSQPDESSQVLTSLQKGRVLRYQDVFVKGRALWARMTFWGKARYIKIGEFNATDQLTLFGELN